MELSVIAKALLNDVDPNIRRMVKPIQNTNTRTDRNIQFNLVGHLTQLENQYLTQRNVTTLRQDDFKLGTYRITQPGIYQLAEDITFHPVPEYDLFPSDQQLRSEYPGRPGPYSLGFFAAIAIETQGVILNLRGFTIKQSLEFYTLQRFFSVLELGNGPFVPKQGPGKFGMNYIGAESVWIKNGTLGLSSHHGIHGNKNTKLLISDLTITNFEAGGIALNQATDTIITRVQIHDSLGTKLKVPVNARFSGAVFLWRHYRSLLNQLATQPNSKKYCFTFGENSMSLAEIYQVLTNLVKHTVETVLSRGINNPVRFTGKSYQYFSNELGLPDGSAMYGVLINKRGVAVDEFGSCNSECVNPNISQRVTVENVSINNLVLHPNETILILNEAGKPQTDFGGSAIMISKCPWWVTPEKNGTNNFTPEISFIQEYDGRVVYDEVLLAQVMLQDYATKTDQKRLAVKSNIAKTTLDWVSNGYSSFQSYGQYNTTRNADIMNHVMKGIVGIRLDFATRATIKGCQVANCYNTGVVGRETDQLTGYLDQGNKESDPNQGHLKSDDTDLGYTGNRCRGLSAVNTSGLVVQQLTTSGIHSKTGTSVGVDLLRNNNHAQLADIKISQVQAGFDSLTEMTVPYTTTQRLPNMCPTAVGMYLRERNQNITLGKHSIQGVCATGFYSSLNCQCEVDFSSFNVSSQRRPVPLTYRLDHTPSSTTDTLR